jgi:hypothetical protein
LFNEFDIAEAQHESPTCPSKIFSRLKGTFGAFLIRTDIDTAASSVKEIRQISL